MDTPADLSAAPTPPAAEQVVDVPAVQAPQVVPAQPPQKSDAAERGIYLVPKAKHDEVKANDAKLGDLQRKLGQLQIDYEMAKLSTMREFTELNEKQNKLVNTIAADAGIDVTSGKEHWVMDVAKGVLERKNQ